MFKNKLFLVIGVFLIVALFTWGSLSAKPKPGIPVTFGEIFEVSLDDPLNLLGSGGQIIILGEGFGVSEPMVSLGLYGALVVTYYDDGEIVAELPLTLIPGDYLLGVLPSGNPESRIDYDLTVNAPSVPAGMVSFFPSTVCPPGWSEETMARGRVVVGLQPGGDIYGTIGNPLTDLENRSHDHDLNLSAGTTGTAGTHKHTGIASFAGVHSHGGATFGPSATNSVDIDDDFQGSKPTNDHYHEIQPSVAHTHLIQEDTGHTHSIGGSNATSSNAHTSDVMPYLQLLACIKD